MYLRNHLWSTQMIEHLGNCHGEWQLLLGLLGAVPFVGAWLKCTCRKVLK